MSQDEAGSSPVARNMQSASREAAESEREHAAVASRREVGPPPAIACVSDHRVSCAPRSIDPPTPPPSCAAALPAGSFRAAADGAKAEAPCSDALRAAALQRARREGAARGHAGGAGGCAKSRAGSPVGGQPSPSPPPPLRPPTGPESPCHQRFKGVDPDPGSMQAANMAMRSAAQPARCPANSIIDELLGAMGLRGEPLAAASQEGAPCPLPPPPFSSILRVASGSREHCK